MMGIRRLLLLFVVAVIVLASQRRASAEIDGGGALDDNRQSFVYYAETGEFAFDQGFPAATWKQLDLSSSSGTFVFHANANPIFTTRSATHLATDFGLSIPSISIGLISQPDLTEAFLLSDLTGFASCGLACDPVSPDLVYIPRVPEPSASIMIVSMLAMWPLRWTFFRTR